MTKLNQLQSYLSSLAAFLSMIWKETTKAIKIKATKVTTIYSNIIYKFLSSFKTLWIFTKLLIVAIKNPPNDIQPIIIK